MRWFCFAALVLSLAILAGCGGGSGSTGSQLGPADYGTTKHVSVGVPVLVALPENTSTGYTWKCEWTPEAAVSLVREYHECQAPIEGSAGTCFYVLRPEQPGQAVITVQYGRWWEGGEVQQPHTFTLNISE